MLKIGLISDLHLGFGYNTEYENDGFEALEEALSNMMDCDLILLTGDLFDSKTPRTTTWGKTLKLLTIPLERACGVELIESDKEIKPAVLKKALKGIPIVAIHGNHERRSKSEINPIQALENGGFLIHLHANSLVFEKDGQRVAIFGMSNVPEAYAREALFSWNPKPKQNAFNILLLHQNIYPYVYSPLDIPNLRVSELPKNFDLIIDGHVHVAAQEKINGTTLLIPGSSIITQFEKSEQYEKKKYYKIEIFEDNTFKINSFPFKSQRSFFYIDVQKEKATIDDVKKAIEEVLNKQKFEKKPIIRVRVKTSGDLSWELETKKIEKEYDKAIIRISKEIVSEEYKKGLEFLKELREKSLSIREISSNLLLKNLKELGFDFSLIDYEEILNVLEEGRVEEAFLILLGKQKTLSKLIK